MSTEMEREQMRSQLQRIDPYDFEHFVGDLWEEEGWETTVTQGSQDRGVDIVADKTGTINQRLAIQAKRYSEGNKVGRPEIQQYYTLKEQDTDADAAVVVTTSEFTKDAQLWAHEHNVKLVDGDELTDMVQRHGREDLLEEYVAESSNETATSSTSSDSASESSSTSVDVDAVGTLRNWTTQAGERWLGVLLVVLAGQVWGLWGMFDPGVTGPVTTGFATGVFVLTWFAAPVVMFVDQVFVDEGIARKLIEAMIWPGVALVLPIIVPAVYLVYRL